MDIRFPYTLTEEDARDAYFVDVLELALAHASSGSYRLAPVQSKMPKARALREMNEGRRFDLVWSMTSREREEKLLPVRIPLMRGLLGHRVLLIRESEQARFDAVEGLDDLKRLTAGQGHDWPDTRILRENDLEVRTATSYDSLFHMLMLERFDYFPRSVAEVWRELEAQGEKGLALEEGLLLRYPAPVYFFVRRDQPELANTLETGLRRAIEAGDLQSLLREHPNTAPLFEKEALRDRRVLDLDNPLLPERTPLDDDELWLDRLEK